MHNAFVHLERDMMIYDYIYPDLFLANAIYFFFLTLIIRTSQKVDTTETHCLPKLYEILTTLWLFSHNRQPQMLTHLAFRKPPPSVSVRTASTTIIAKRVRYARFASSRWAKRA